MSRHRRKASTALPAVLVGVVALLGAGAALLLRDSSDQAGSTAASTPCAAALHIVTASSFAPVLTHLAPTLDAAGDCVHLTVDVADGRTAAAQVAELRADVWVPDDAAWAGVAGSTELAEAPIAGAGTVLATSPIYMVTDQVTAGQLAQAGNGWRDLANLVSTDSGVRLVARDPAGSGDGLVGIGGVGEAVWVEDGMDASAAALARARPATRTVSDQALPAERGEVGLVAEYALVPEPGDAIAASASPLADFTVVAGSDYANVLRYTWLPTGAAAADPALTRPLERVLAALTTAESDAAFAAAGLRRPDGGPPSAATGELPPVTGEPFEVLGPHHVDHVFATWYPEERRSDILVVLDISGSMAELAPGSTRPLIDLVRDGVLELGGLLPDDSQLAVWEFGSLLDPPRDYRTLLERGPLDTAQRQRLTAAAGALAPQQTGTGLYDTILAAYLDARDGYREGTPNHVVLFTDGRAEDDPGSISIQEMSAQLSAAQDPARPVYLTIITFGPEAEAELLDEALKVVDGYVEHLTTADEVEAVFIHVAAGGVHH